MGCYLERNLVCGVLCLLVGVIPIALLVIFFLPGIGKLARELSLLNFVPIRAMRSILVCLKLF